MRRILVCGIGLSFFATLSARSKPDPLLFVFQRVDRAQGLAYLRPVIAPDVGVQLASGSSQLVRGTVLRCQPSTRSQPAVVQGQLATVSELILDCGDHKFVVKGLDFTQRVK